jgi:hypothetical protein
MNTTTHYCGVHIIRVCMSGLESCHGPTRIGVKTYWPLSGHSFIPNSRSRNAKSWPRARIRDQELARECHIPVRGDGCGYNKDGYPENGAPCYIARVAS